MKQILDWIDSELAKLDSPADMKETMIFPPLRRAYSKVRTKLANVQDDLWWMRDERLKYFHVFPCGDRVIVSVTFGDLDEAFTAPSRKSAMRMATEWVNGEFA